jgi:N-acetylneuraminate epimerase
MFLLMRLFLKTANRFASIAFMLSALAMFLMASMSAWMPAWITPSQCMAADAPKEDDSQYAPQPQDSLKLMLSIEWKKGPDLPQGFQDSGFGMVGRTLVTAGGFCQGTSGWADGKLLDQLKPGRYPRGFLNKAWMFDLDHSDLGWRALPAFPGQARQGFAYAVVGDQFFCWGGFNYSEPYCYRDGYCLTHAGDQWAWTAMPPLPWQSTAGGMCAIGTKLYLMGGSDYDSVKFRTNSLRNGEVKRLGARLLVLDTKQADAGWKELTPCPGSPRFAHAVAALDGKLYVIGGAAGDDNPAEKYATVVDNWRYDPAADSWQRLRDLPVSSGNFPPGQIVAFQRYLVLVGGYQYESMMGIDGQLRRSYGKAIRHYAGHEYYSDMFVYDTQTNSFGVATPLPLNNNGPMTVVEGDRIHLIGGETGGCEMEGEKFGHHPDLYLIGKLREAAQ